MSCSSSRKRFAAVAHRTGPREHPLTVVGEWDRGLHEVFSTPPPRTFFEDTITRIVTQGRAILIESRMLNGVVERRPIMLCSGHTPLLDLPYEIFLLIFAHMDADGIMNLLSTCHSLYSHFKDEPIWRELCTRYGVVDLSHFPHQSFFAVYASLLYTFGPLLGLWASDHPFSGNVIEFRMVEEPNLGPVILGEVWRFQSHVVNASDPKLPEYLEFVRIRPTWNESGLPGLAELYWYVREEKPTEVPSLALLASTQYSTFLRYRDYITGDINLAPHPDFPSSSALWYDRTRPLPRLEQVPCGDFRNEEIPEDTDDALLMFPGGEMKPPALAFLPTTAKDVSYLHHPLLTIPDLRISHHEQGEPVAPTPSRYYPLRFPVPHKHLYRDPGDGDWSRECLDGLWIGANGAHDSEVLLVDSSDRKETKAWKVTGTMHIPRGETCWKFNPDDTVALSSISSELEFGDVPSTSRVFTGSGHICPEGFITGEDSWVDLIIAVLGKDEIKIRWPELEYTARYRRCKPREVTCEQVIQFKGIRRSIAWM